MSSSERDQFLKKSDSLVLAELGISAYRSLVFTVVNLSITISTAKSSLMTGTATTFLTIPLVFDLLVISF
jgi:hypothetical protein